jgi:hypothetical protein
VVKKCPTHFEALKRGHLVLRWDRDQRIPHLGFKKRTNVGF